MEYSNSYNGIETITIRALNLSVWANKNNIIKVIRKIKELKLYNENKMLYLIYYGSILSRKNNRIYLYEIQDYYGHDHLGDIYINGDFVFIETKEGFVYPLFEIIKPKNKKQEKPQPVGIKKLDCFIGGGGNNGK